MPPAGPPCLFARPALGSWRTDRHLHQAAAHNILVACLSPAALAGYSQSLFDAISRAYNAGILVRSGGVAAANSGACCVGAACMCMHIQAHHEGATWGLGQVTFRPTRAPPPAPALPQPHAGPRLGGQWGAHHVELPGWLQAPGRDWRGCPAGRRRAGLLLQPWHRLQPLVSRLPCAECPHARRTCMPCSRCCARCTAGAAPPTCPNCPTMAALARLSLACPPHCPSHTRHTGTGSTLAPLAQASSPR